MLYRVTVTPESYARVRARIDRAKDGVRNGLTNGIQAAIINMQRYLKENVLSGQLLRNRTGALRGAVGQRMDSPTSGSVFIGREAPYARFLNDGTQPHIIFPKSMAGAFSSWEGRSKYAPHLRDTFLPNYRGGPTMLAWQGKDGMRFARFVHHPGNMAFQYMEGTLEATKDDTIRIIQGWVARGLDDERSR